MSLTGEGLGETGRKVPSVWALPTRASLGTGGMPISNPSRHLPHGSRRMNAQPEPENHYGPVERSIAIDNLFSEARLSRLGKKPASARRSRTLGEFTVRSLSSVCCSLTSCRPAADPSKSKNAKVTLLYQHDLSNLTTAILNDLTKSRGGFASK